MTPARVRCAIYTRKSSEEGLDQEYNSLHAQRDACAAYVASQAGEGWVLLAGEYDDGGFSGGNLERPGLKRLLADIAAKKVDVVVVYKVDRLTRSLSDFARIVDTFDQAGASFVSVTQAFNTTTSMGRLTLNMLLSFAQFEREVTGERIRDKIAASKRKGMWMGGNTPLGYDATGRTLKVNPTEADLVRHIFQRYLHLGSVHALRDELHCDGHRSKLSISQSGAQRGGKSFERGALFHLLANRVYLGEVPHKGEYFPGLHPGIIDAQIFDLAQAKLAECAGPKVRSQRGLEPIAPRAPLAGLLFDDAGNRMSPVATKSRGVVHGYYVSSALIAGRADQAGSTGRAPARQIEELVKDRASRLLGQKLEWGEIRSALTRVVLERSSVRLEFKPRPEDERHQFAIATLPISDTVRHEEDVLCLTVVATVGRAGGRSLIVGPGGGSAIETRRFNAPLMSALARAEAWKAMLLCGEAPTMETIATREGFRVAYVQRLVRLAFLSPRLKRAILDGKTPPRLNLEAVMRRNLPLLWADQFGALIGPSILAVSQ